MDSGARILMNEARVGAGEEERVLADEARFADLQYSPFAHDLDINPVMWSKYAQPESLWDHRQLGAILLGDVRGKRVLDLGCGMGEETAYLARLGARVTAIDISQKGIEITRRRAEHNGVAANVDARVMRADKTEFAAESFDAVHGLGILHHLGVDVGLREVHRVLKPGGIGVFYEPLGDSPTVEAAKRWIMASFQSLGFEEVTEHEENLRLDDIARAGARFAAMQVYPFHLLYRAKRFAPVPLRDLLRKIDCGLLTVMPVLRRYAGAVVMKVSK
jgi:2-polyprenyl-3-methyl-5-hydroxy-6-metoxy-1,4-benzoquinol methylase